MQLVLGQGCRVAKRLPNVHQVRIGNIDHDLFGVMSFATRFTTCATEILNPRMVARPPNNPGM